MACALGLRRVQNARKGCKKMTNGDKIREMSNSALAEIIMCPYHTDEPFCGKRIGCFDCCMEWLESEFKDEEF